VKFFGRPERFLNVRRFLIRTLMKGFIIRGQRQGAIDQIRTIPISAKFQTHSHLLKNQFSGQQLCGAV
jgi:hypothetical protein